MLLPRRYSSDAVVLARRNFGEADRILILYTKDYGKLSVLAKGVRKLTSRKRGGVENFSHIKFAASRGSGLDLITEVEVVDTFANVRANLAATSVAYFLCETVARLTRDGEENRPLFTLLTTSLASLAQSTGLGTKRKKFIEKALVQLGYWPADKVMTGHDKILETVVEREMVTARVGKKLQS